jgi:Fe-S oxidoreductase
LLGGTMCPSYQVTRDEKHSTRGRANMLRQVLSNTSPQQALASGELDEVLDLCLSCKACKSECPSTVDIAKMKAESMQWSHDVHGVPWRSRMIAAFPFLLEMASLAPWLWNGIFGRPFFRRQANKLCGFHPDRTIPLLHHTTLRRWFTSRPLRRPRPSQGLVHLFCDEFTNSFDVTTGIAAIELLEALGYEVVIPKHQESGRSALSKGLLRKARELAEKNVGLLCDVITAESPLVGIEPSAILTFRDEYPELLRGREQERARALAKNCLTIDEWISREMDAGRITRASFHNRKKTIKLHGHCHQKALSSLVPTVKMLELPAGHQVQMIPSGCCGMAGSFGYESEHFDLANSIGELVLFPAIRNSDADVVIAAAGTSCRHQIHDGTGRVALHPVQILRKALVEGIAEPRGSDQKKP